MLHNSILMENLVWPAKETNLYKNSSDIIICSFVQGVYSHILENRYPSETIKTFKKGKCQFLQTHYKKVNKQAKQTSK